MIYRATISWHDMKVPLLLDPDYHDVREERVGGFTGPVTPSDLFGKYAGPARRPLAGRGRLRRRAGRAASGLVR